MGAIFHEYGTEREQSPLEQERPCDDIHWFESYLSEISAVVVAEINKN